MLKVALSVVLFIFLIFVLLFSLYIVSSNEINKESNENLITLEEKVDYYNAHMSEDERSFRNTYGLGNESIGENYNSMSNNGYFHI